MKRNQQAYVPEHSMETDLIIIKKSVKNYEISNKMKKLFI